MARVVLVNMPFTDVLRPPLGLLQLEAVMNHELGERVGVDVVYPNNAFCKLVGWDLYHELNHSMRHLYTGLGDWIFREAAFPDAPDNTEDYLRRCYPQRDPATKRLRDKVLEIRKSVPSFIEQVIDEHELVDADIVGLTTMFLQTCGCIALARALKRRRPEQTVVLGGPNCDAPMGEVLAKRVDCLDAVFSGPGLKSFPEYVRSILDGDPRAAGAIRGVLTRKRSLLSTRGNEIGEELNINETPPVHYDHYLQTFREAFDEPPAKPAISFQTSRGCWWGEKSHCTFCGLNADTMGYRSLRPALALDLFADIFRHRDDVALYNAVDNILPKEYPSQVLPHIDAPPGSQVFYEVKADMTEEEIQALAAARVTLVQPGIEALATSTLKLMRKGTTAFTNIKFLGACRRAKVEPSWNLLIGFPGEPASTYRFYLECLPLLTHLYPPTGAFPVRFDRFAPYFTKAEEYGLKLRPMDFYRLVYPFSEAELFDLAYYFVDGNLRSAYQRDMFKYIAKISAAIESWRVLWKRGPDAAPQLVFESELRVLDSRTGTPVHHELSEAEAACLRQLQDRPTSANGLARRLEGVGRGLSSDEFDDALAQLRGKRLLFEERGRMLSLVFERPQPQSQPLLDPGRAAEDAAASVELV